MDIIKRNGSTEAYERRKIARVIERAFASVDSTVAPDKLDAMVDAIERALVEQSSQGFALHVEEIQDLVEKTLIEENYYKEVKSFILYREDRKRKRRTRGLITACFGEVPEMDELLKEIERDFQGEAYGLEYLWMKFQSFYKPALTLSERFYFLIKACVELTTQEAPRWEFIAARIYFLEFSRELAARMAEYGIDDFYEKLEFLTEEGLYGSYILQHYSREELLEAASFIDERRNTLINYSGLELLLKRYVVRSHAGVPLESVQEMFLGIALHLAMLEERDQRLVWVRRFYDMLSTLKVTMATPTLANARKPFHQLSSCFIDTVPDSLDGIYRSIDNFAQVSKFGGGMGLYFGKVRAMGSAIRGFEGAAGGVIRWIIFNMYAIEGYSHKEIADMLGISEGTSRSQYNRARSLIQKKIQEMQ